jgi:uncharacterized protein (DUF2147 family)
MKLRVISIFVLSALGFSATVYAQPASIAGRWTTQSKDAIIEIAPCGVNMCGRIIRFLVPPPNGNDQKDVNNSNPKLRERKLLGMPVLQSLSPQGKEWKGTIYDPRSGKSYRSVVFLTKKGTLSVKGCLGPICSGESWSKSGS